jgi:hypothetical protein
MVIREKEICNCGKLESFGVLAGNGASQGEQNTSGDS